MARTRKAVNAEHLMRLRGQLSRWIENFHQLIDYIEKPDETEEERPQRVAFALLSAACFVRMIQIKANQRNGLLSHDRHIVLEVQRVDERWRPYCEQLNKTYS